MNLKIWNKNIFGDIFKRKQWILRRLESTSRVLQTNLNDRLNILRNKLWEEYNTIVHYEETYWYQQAYNKLIALGDKNSRYLHMPTLNRRRCNKIVALKDQNDE